jgi:hypothetical protein
MDQDRNQEPAKRLRSILSSPDGEMDSRPPSPEQPQSSSPLSRLPQRKSLNEAPSPVEPTIPAARIATPESKLQTHPPAPVSEPVVTKQRSTREWKFGPPFWTITGILSLIVNGILIAVLLVLYQLIGEVQELQGAASNIGSSVLGGLYTNFEKMDQATIKTVIPVDAQIPLDISVPVQTTTQITLAESVNIPNAQVVINTGGLNINSNARVTLPAGTPLMVNLNFNLPVQTTIPIHLEVPVNIPMAETELHEPFVGLQQVVHPWYCIVEPNALRVTGQPLCR